MVKIRKLLVSVMAVLGLMGIFMPLQGVEAAGNGYFTGWSTDNIADPNRETRTRYGYKDVATWASTYTTTKPSTPYYKAETVTVNKTLSQSKVTGGVSVIANKVFKTIASGEVQQYSHGVLIDVGTKANGGTITASFSGCTGCNASYGHPDKRNVGIYATNTASVYQNNNATSGWTALSAKVGSSANGATVTANANGYRYFLISYSDGCWNEASYQYSITYPAQETRYYLPASWGSAVYNSDTAYTQTTSRQPLSRTEYRYPNYLIDYNMNGGRVGHGNSANILTGIATTSSTTSGYMTYSIDGNGVVTVKANQDDGYGFVPGRVTLAAGRTYRFMAESSGSWGSSGDTVQAYLMLDGQSATYIPLTGLDCTFTPTVAGEYWLRLDVNKSGKEHTFKNLSIFHISRNVKSSATTLPTPTRVGYTFGGWYTSSALTGTKQTSIAKGTYGDKAYYAKWTANNYTATFDANGGGTVTPSTITKAYGSALGTLPTVSRTGYTFNGWYTAETGGTKISTTTTMPLNGATYYAQWKPITYDVVFNGNGSTSGSMSNQKFTYDVAQNLSANAFERVHTVTYNYNGSGAANTTDTSTWTFKGWATSSSGSVVYSDKQSVSNLSTTNDGIVNLYAKWDCSVSDYIRLPYPSRTGYTFLGWNTKADGSGTMYEMEDGIVKKISLNKDLTLYAQWSPNTYKVTLDNQSATTAGTTAYWYQFNTTKVVNGVTAYYYSDANLTTPLTSGYYITVPSKTGYTFSGYYTGTNGSGTQYVDANGKCINNLYAAVASNTTLYAYWTADAFSATFDANGGTTANPSTITKAYGATLGTLPTTSRTGYTFKGWFTAASGGTQISTTTKLTANVTYYAQWTVNSFELKIDPNGGHRVSDGSTAVISVSKNYGATENISVRARTGYTLTGYIMKNTSTGSTAAADLGGAKFTFDSSTKTGVFTQGTVAITLVAQWSPNTYKVTLDNQSATTAGTTAYWYQFNTTKVVNGVTAYYYSDANLTTPLTSGYYITIPSKTGYTFKGYYTGTNGAGTQYVDANGKCINNLYASVASDTTLYAYWSLDSYTISYDANGGTGSIASHTTSYGQKIKIADNTFTKHGYNFAGWTTNSNGTNDGYGWFNSSTLKGWEGTWSYDNGQYGIANNKLVLYAMWKPNSGTAYKVEHYKMNLDGSTYTLANTENLSGSTGASITPTRFDYEGFTAPSAQTTTIAANGSTVVKYYYTRNKYTLTIQAGDSYSTVGSSTTSGSYYYGAEYTLNGKPNDGYHFKEWNGSDDTVLTSNNVKKTIPAYNITWKIYSTANSYSIKFDGNGSTSGSMTNLAMTYGVAKNLTANAFQRKFTVTYNGNGGTAGTSSASATSTFNGWATSSTGTKVYNDKASVNNLTTTNGGTYTLYANWTDQQITLGTATRTGYEFLSWNTKQDGTGTSYSAGQKVTVSSSMTLYAQWNEEKYTLTINPNGGAYDGSTSNATYSLTYNQAFSLKLPTRTGYRFTGWKKTGTEPVFYYDYGNGYSYSEMNSSIGTATRTLSNDSTYTNYKWENLNATADAWNYITLTPSYSVSAGETIKISGWIRINSTPVGLNFYHGAKSNDYSNKKLTLTSTSGEWQYFEITRTFTEATTTAVFQIYTANLANKTGTIDFDLKQIDVVRTSDGLHQDSGLKMGTGDLTLTAQWEAKTVDVIFHRNTSTSDTTTASQRFTYAVSGQSFSAKGWTRAGYTLSGWSTSSSATSATYGVTSAVSSEWINSNYPSIDLYAVWTPIPYTVIFDGNGADGGSMGNQSLTYNVSANLIANAYTKTGYKFAGWNTVANGSGTTYADKATVKNLTETNGGSVTLYAQWTPSADTQYTVKHYQMNLDGTNYTLKDTDILSGETGASITPNRKTYTGFTSPSSQTTTIKADGSTLVEYYYTRNQYKLELLGLLDDVQANNITGFGLADISVNGKTVASDVSAFSQKYYYGSTYDIFNIEALKGMEFLGVSAGALEGTITADTKVRLKFTSNSYTITYNYNGGTVASENPTKYKADSASITLINPTKTGYSLTSWTEVLSTTKWTDGFIGMTSGAIEESNATYPYSVYSEPIFLRAGITYTLTATGYDGVRWRVFATDGSYIGSESSSATYKPTQDCYARILFYNGLSTTNRNQMKITATLGTSVTIPQGSTGNRSYTANWKINQYTATFDANGGTAASPNTITKDYGAQLGTLPTTSRTGYTFNGWYTAKTGGTKISTTTTMPANNVTYYAQWKANTYTVKFTGNGATSGSMNDQTFTYDVAQNLTANAFKRAYVVTYNYNGSGASNTTATATAAFNGWLGSDSKTYADKASVKNLVTSGSFTMTAQWTLGSVSLPTPTRTGYTFLGWYTAASGGTKVGDGGDSYTPTSGTTLYAQWKTNSYTMTFNANNCGTVNPTSITKNYNAELGTLPTFTVKTGYTFLGWYPNSNGTGTQITASSKMPAGNTTVYASCRANTYEIEFKGNGSTSGSMANLAMTYDVAKNLTANAFKKAYTVTYNYNGNGAANTTATANSTFAGWKGENGTSYSDKQSVINLTATDKDVFTMTAQWTAGTVTLPTPTRTGYTFLGWYTAATSGTRVGDGGDTYTPTAGITLYAQWKVNQYTATFDANGGTAASPNTITKDYGVQLGTLPTTSRTGYTFNGWYTAKTGGTKISTTTTMPASNVTYYAQWTANTYTIKFDANGGSGTMNNITMTYDVAKNLTANAFTRTGYTFTGWNTAANGTGTAYVDKASVKNLVVSNNGEITLYAQWRAHTYTIEFNANTGTGSMSSISMTYDVSKTLATNTFTKVGHYFDSWNTVADGSGTAIADKASVKNLTSTDSGKVILYAQWKQNPHTVTFVANKPGATIDPEAMTVLYGDMIGTLPTAHSKGMEILGWYTNADGTGTQVTETTIITGDLTAYAQWKIADYDLIFNPTGGTVSPTRKTIIYDQKYGELPIPIRPEYVFSGWYTAEVGGDLVSEFDVMGEGDVYLYAHWFSADFASHDIMSEDVSITVTSGNAYVGGVVGALDASLRKVEVVDVNSNDSGYALISDRISDGETIEVFNAQGSVNTNKLFQHTIGGFNMNGALIAVTPTDTFTVSAEMDKPTTATEVYYASDAMSCSFGTAMSFATSQTENVMTKNLGILNKYYNYWYNAGTKYPRFNDND